MKFIKFKKTNIHNLISGFLQRIFILISQLVLIPVYINTLGMGMYGEWLILTTIPNYLLLSDFGLTLTVTNEVCRLINLKRFDEQIELFKSTITLFLSIGGILLLTFFFFAFFIDFNEFFKFSFISNTYAKTILLAYVINVCVSLIFRSVIGYFKAINKVYLHEYFLALTILLSFLSTLVILLIKAPLFYIPISLALIRILVIVITTRILYSVDFFKIGLSWKFNKTVKLIPASLKLGFYQLGTALFLQGCTLLVGIVLGPATVVVFNTIRTMTNAIKSFIAVVYVPTMQEFTYLLTNNLRKKAIKKLNSLAFLVLLLSIIACSIIYFLRGFIFELWIGEVFQYSTLFLVLMLITIIIQNVWNSASMLPMSINKMNELAVYPILTGILLIIQYFTLSKTGLTGLAFGMLVVDIFMLILVFRINIKTKELNEN